MRRLLVALAATLIAALMASAATPTAAATSFSDVNPLFCAAFGGQTTRPAGTELRLRFGENSYTFGNLVAWLNAVTTTASINGGPVIDLTNDFNAISFEDPFYVTRNFYDTGIVLQPGVSVSFVYDLELSHQVAFATNVGNVNPGNHPVFFEPAPTVPGGFPAPPWSCTVTGA